MGDRKLETVAKEVFLSIPPDVRTGVFIDVFTPCDWHHAARCMVDYAGILDDPREPFAPACDMPVICTTTVTEKTVISDVLICLWLLERMYDIKGRDTRTRHPSPVGACAALIKAVSKILRYGTEKERLDGLADAVEDVRRWVMLLETENGITDEELGEWVERKTVRQQRRIEDDK